MEGKVLNQQKFIIFYRFGIILLTFLTLYCFLLIKPLWKPVLTTILIAMIPFLLGGFIAFLLHPLVGKLQAFGLKRAWAILVIYILFFGGTSYGIYLGYPLLIEQMKEFSEQIPHLANHYKQWVQNLEASTSRWPDGLQTQMEERITKFELWLNGFIEKSMKVLMGLANFLLILLVIPFISFYLLKDIDQVKRAAWYMTPKKWRSNAVDFMSAVNISLGSYIRGQMLVCGIIGTAAAILFWVVGIQYPILLGAIIATTNIIPYFGPLIGAVPVLIIALLSSVNKAIIAVIIVFVLQFIEGNILSPYIAGKSLQMHPLFIIAALIIGGEAAGIIGLIVAVPILAILKIAIIHSRDHLINKKQHKH